MNAVDPTLAEIDRDAILSRLRELDGSRKMTARSLDISPRNLSMKLAEYRRAGYYVTPSDRHDADVLPRTCLEILAE